MNNTPTTAYIVVGRQTGAQQKHSTIRSNNKKLLQEHRHAQLLSAYAVMSLPDVEGGIFQKFGHCAEDISLHLEHQTLSINGSGSALYEDYSERCY